MAGWRACGAVVGSCWGGAVAGPRENEIGAAAGRHACVCEERGAEGDVRANCEEEETMDEVFGGRGKIGIKVWLE